MGRSSDTEPVEFEDAVVKHVSPKAIKVHVYDIDNDPGDDRDPVFWVPRSVVHAESEISGDTAEKGDRGTLVLQGWWAEQEGYA